MGYNGWVMRIGLTFDLQTDPHDRRQAEFDPPRTIQAVEAALVELGHDVSRLGSARDLVMLPERLRTVELVFNIAEGSCGRCREAWVPTLLELAGVPYVGSGPAALALGLDKAMSKRLALACGVPTPPWISVDHPQALPRTIPVEFPVVVKPRYEGSGIGIDEGAVVRDAEALRQRVQWLYDQWQQPMLIERFIPHGELTICVIGNEEPIAYPAIQRPLDPSSRLSYHVVTRPPVAWEAPVELTAQLETQARRMALAMFQAIRCRDMARVDVRVDERGLPWFLEINPLPSLDPEGSLGLLAEYLGVSYAHLIGRILDAACQRLGHAARSPTVTVA